MNASRPAFGSDLAVGALSDLWRGILGAGFVYFGQCAGGARARLASYGRRLTAAHGWYDPAPPPREDGAPPEAEKALLAGVRGLVRENGARFVLDARAVASLERAAALAPGQSWSWLALGVARYLGRDFRGAAEAFETARSAAPGWLWPDLLRADSLHFDGRLAEARSEFERIAEEHPRSSWAWALLSRSHYLAGDPRMKTDLDRAVALEPGSGWIYAWRAAARQRLDDPAGAEADYLESLRLSPLYERTHSWYGAYLVGAGRNREALKALARADRLVPWSEVTCYALARAWNGLGEPARARRAFERAIRLNTDNAWVWGLSDVFWGEAAAFRSTLAQSDKEIAATPDWAMGRAWRAQTLLRMGRVPESLVESERACALGPRLVWAWAWRGEGLRRRERWAEAERCFTRALSIDRRCGWALLGRGASRLALDRARAAEKDLSAGLALAPNAGRGVGFGWRGEARRRLGREEEARADFAEAARRHPDWKRRLSLGAPPPEPEKPAAAA